MAKQTVKNEENNVILKKNVVHERLKTRKRKRINGDRSFSWEKKDNVRLTSIWNKVKPKANNVQ